LLTFQDLLQKEIFTLEDISEFDMDADDGIQEQTYLEDKGKKREQFKLFIESTKLELQEGKFE
jgi:hypothetical protein